MGKLELEAKDETAGILEEDWQTEEYFGLLVLALFSGVC
jgi:hypothetical protein